jgi:transposase-like protein
VEDDISGQKTTEKPKDRLREKAVTLLLSEKSVESAARKLGVSARTLYRWASEPEFRKSLSEAKSNLQRMASAILARNATKAATTLAEIFLNKKGSINQSPRVSAALWNLRLLHEAIELEDLEERIRKLEQQGGQQGDSF